MEREALLEELGDAICRVERPHPVRVAIDGVGVAGKTILADELVEPLRRRGRSVIRASIDGFHNPKDVRYRRGPGSPEGYYRDSFDYEALVALILEPLGPGGDRRYRPAVFDFRTESRVELEERVADAGNVLLFDGIFLLRPELRDRWDFRIFVDTSFDVTVARAETRDIPLFGSASAVRERYLERYVPGERLYLARARPGDHADVIVGNDDPLDATLRWRNVNA